MCSMCGSCGWDSPVAPAGTGSGLVKPEGLLPMGSRSVCLRSPSLLVPLEMRGHGGTCPTGLLLPCSGQDSSSIWIWSVLPAGTQGKRWKLLKTHSRGGGNFSRPIPGLWDVARPAAPALGLVVKSAAQGDDAAGTGSRRAEAAQTEDQHEQMQERWICKVPAETGKWMEQRRRGPPGTEVPQGVLLRQAGAQESRRSSQGPRS